MGPRVAANRILSLLLLCLLLPACGINGSGTLQPTIAPLRPDSVVAARGPARVTLAWAPSSAAATYEIKRATTAGGPYTTVPAGSAVSGISFTDPGLTNGTRYYYVLSAKNNFGVSPDSQEVSAIPGLSFVASSGSVKHTLGLEADGTVWAWGSNWYGVLASNTVETSLVPIQVPGLSQVKAVSASQNNSMALTQDGQVWVWGSNTDGQLGDTAVPLTTFRRQPSPVPGLTNVIAIGMGDLSAVVLRNDGTVWA